MAIKRELNADMKALKAEARALEAEREKLTEEVNKRIAENEATQTALQAYIDMRFGVKPKKEKKQKIKKETSSGRRTRKDRSYIRPGVLAAVNSSPQGIRRRGIISSMGIDASDKAGQQYVSNTLGALVKEGKIKADLRMYFPIGADTSSATSSSSEEKPSYVSMSSSTDDDSSSGESGSSDGGGSGGSSGSSSF